MTLLEYLFIFIFGLIIGSFLSALTYRVPRGQSILKGRSKCDKCGKTINWYDNVPLFSFLLLRGKCRYCGKKISVRYPLIEFTTGVLFVFFYYIGSLRQISIFEIYYYLLISIILLAVFIIDFEHQVIPDELVFLLLFLSFFVTLDKGDKFYQLIFSGFAASLFLLIINLVTIGRGMGLGDVKLALFGGIFFGFPGTLMWLFLSFVIGATVGLGLIYFKRAEFGKHIAFGPFLVVSFFVTLLYGESLAKVFFPYF